MKPVITFPDAQLAVRDALREILPASEAATVSTRDIEGKDGNWPCPYVQVALDGTYRDARLDGRANVRILCYGRDVGDSLRLAALCEGLLLAEVATDALRGCSPLTGPLDSQDPDNGLPFAYFTITARLRPHQL